MMLSPALREMARRNKVWIPYLGSLAAVNLENLQDLHHGQLSQVPLGEPTDTRGRTWMPPWTGSQPEHLGPSLTTGRDPLVPAVAR